MQFHCNMQVIKHDVCLSQKMLTKRLQRDLIRGVQLSGETTGELLIMLCNQGGA